MAATLHRFQAKRDKLKLGEASRLRQMVLDFGCDLDLPESVVGRVVSAVDRETEATGRWPFMLLGIRENQAVVDWLGENSSRPIKALSVWAMLLTAVRHDTQEIMLTRREIAGHVGISADNVSRILSELVEFGAISRRREGRAMRYFLNPWAGTHLGGRARDEAQAEARQLRLID